MGHRCLSALPTGVSLLNNCHNGRPTCQLFAVHAVSSALFSGAVQRCNGYQPPMFTVQTLVRPQHRRHELPRWHLTQHKLMPVVDSQYSSPSLYTTASISSLHCKPCNHSSRTTTNLSNPHFRSRNKYHPSPQRATIPAPFHRVAHQNKVAAPHGRESHSRLNNKSPPFRSGHHEPP
jgi:hypothetical protein